MLTRCPACSTTFRVSTETLQARKGKVRCGHCMTVFNALEFLSLEAELLSLPTSGNAAPKPTPPPNEATASRATTVLAAADDQATVTASFRPPPTWDGKKKSASSKTSQPTRWRFLGWLLACLVLAVVLLGQLAYHYRVDLVAAQPGWRSVLEPLCQCAIPLPQEIDDITLEGSELRPQTDGNVQLSATLRNRGNRAEAFPTLEVTFTDVNDQVLAVKSLPPTDLITAAQLKKGLPAQTEQTLTVSLTVSDLPVVGYRLYLYYP